MRRKTRGMTQRTVAAIAGDGARVDMDDLGRCHGRGGWVWAAPSGMMILCLVWEAA